MVVWLPVAHAVAATVDCSDHGSDCSDCSSDDASICSDQVAVRAVAYQSVPNPIPATSHKFGLSAPRRRHWLALVLSTVLTVLSVYGCTHVCTGGCQEQSSL